MKSRKAETEAGPGAEEGDVDPKAALKKLEEYGERFMSMFDDGGARKKGGKASTSGRGAAQAGRSAPSGLAAAAADHGAGAGPGRPAGSVGPAAKQRPGQGGAAANGGKQPPSGTMPGRVATPTAAGSPGKGNKKRKGGSGDEIDAIMRGAGKKAKLSTQAGGAGGQVGKAAAAAAAAAAQQAVQAEAMRRERKLFMSHKASKVHGSLEDEEPQEPGRRRKAKAAKAAAAPSDDAGLTPAEFQRLQLEVEKFASTSLDKKAAKQYKARMLERLGAKADTAPRTAASIGKGMAKVAAKRTARALEEAIETGMVQRKGLGKKKRAMQSKNRDRGLMEAGNFKNGVMRVKPLQKTREHSGKLRLPKGVL